MQDLKFAFRQLLKHPGFTAVAVLSLALGIGVNTTIFSIVNTFLFPRLPFKDSDRLVTLWEVNAKNESRRRSAMFSTFQEWRTQSQSFERLGLFDGFTTSVTLARPGEANRVLSQSVDADLFPVLGIRPALGRWFLPQDFEDPINEQDARPIIISHRTWQGQLGGDTRAIGQMVNVDGVSRPIVGVMPPGFWIIPGLGEEVALWTCIDLSHSPSSRRLLKVGRLKEGITMAQAQAEMATIHGRLEEAEATGGVSWVPRLETLRRAYFGDGAPVFYFLHGIVGFVLLIACANVANLLLARGMMRQRELAIRAAAGAPRWRLIRQLLTESLLLSALGGALGVLMVPWTTNVFWALAPERIPLLSEVVVDGRVLSFTLGISVLTGILCGFWPAVRATRFDLNQLLQEAGRGVHAGPRRLGRNLLLAFEVATAMILLVGAGLMISGFLNAQRADMNLVADRVLTGEILLSGPKYASNSTEDGAQATARVNQFFSQVLEQINNLPGVESVGMTSRLPRQRLSLRPFAILGRDHPIPGAEPQADLTEVDAGFFQALGAPLLKGRFISRQDDERASKVVVINRTLAERYFPGEDPIGKAIGITNRNPADDTASLAEGVREIVGVVGDLDHLVFRNDRPAVMYGSFLQHDQWGKGARSLRRNLVIRTSVPPLNLATQVRSIVGQVDANQTAHKLQSLRQHLIDSLALNRFVLGLVSAIAAVAVLLATMGIYGVIAYFVSQRTREFGIRMALGARKHDIMRVAIRQVSTPTLIGVAVGMGGGFALQLALSKAVFGVSAMTLPTYAVLAIVMVSVALLACFFPARNATHVDPIVALRCE